MNRIISGWRMRIFVYPFLIGVSFSASAQVPQAFDLQGVARNDQGDPLVEQAITLRLSILADSTTGPLIYQETQNVETSQFGLFSVAIGLMDEDFVFQAIEWGSGPHYIKIEMDADGGQNFVDMGISQLLSVPYALHAGSMKAGTVPGEMQYWDGWAWSAIPPGEDGMTLCFCDGRPTWSWAGDCWKFTPGDGLTDVNGNEYPTILLAGKEWMARDLRTTNYANGDPIAFIASSNGVAWEAATGGAYTIHPINAPDLGLVYNCHAGFDPRNVCPAGWHLPTRQEWIDVLHVLDPDSMYINGTGNSLSAGRMLKSREYQHWGSAAFNHSNSSGFTWRKGGFMWPNGFFENGAARSMLIFTNDGDPTIDCGWARAAVNTQDVVLAGSEDLRFGFNVRCVKD